MKEARQAKLTAAEKERREEERREEERREEERREEERWRRERAEAKKRYQALKATLDGIKARVAARKKEKRANSRATMPLIAINPERRGKRAI